MDFCILNSSLVQSVEHVRKCINIFVDGLILLLIIMDMSRSYIIHLPPLGLSTSTNIIVLVILF